MTTSAQQKQTLPPRQGNGSINAIPREILGSSILIVDDDELHCQLIAVILTQDGFQNLHFARDGREALQKAYQLMPDMIILDMLMPNIDGLEVCRQLRSTAEFENIPIIAHTIKHDPEERAEIYEAGATDIFPKPVSEREVHNRVYMYLKYTRLVKGLKDYRERLSNDLLTARSMQNALLPDSSLLDDMAKSHKIEISCQYESSDELGGDFWGINIIDENRILVYITDFSGHGISASLNTFRLHSLITNYQKSQGSKERSPAEKLEILNRDLFKLLPVEQFATMLCGIIDLKNENFTYASAASTIPIKLTVGTREISGLDPSGFPLGMIENATYENHVIPFKKGELLFFYSDVLVESPDQKGQMIGDDYFMELCQETSASLPDDHVFLDRLLKGFDMMVVRPLLDDLTAVTIKRL